MLQTDLRGRVNNIDRLKNGALTPLFEAISNAIHAIEDANKENHGVISVEVIRNFDTPVAHKLDHNSEERNPEIVGFRISDNGVGFNDINFESFQISDSTYKFEKGGKGIGRFTWLKVFELVRVESVYRDKGSIKFRNFDFSITGINVSLDSICDSEEDSGTAIELLYFKGEFQKEIDSFSKVSTKIALRTIAQRTLEHCLTYFIGNKAPDIFICDGKDKINLTAEFEKINKSIITDNEEIDNLHFTLNHVKLFNTTVKAHNCFLCANYRVVKVLQISKELGTVSKFDDDGAKFSYALYISSPYFDDNMDSTRQNLNIPQKQSNLNLQCVSHEEIKNLAIKKAKIFLSTYLKSIYDEKVQLVRDYVSNVDPTLRMVASYCPELYNDIEPNSPHEKIREILYKYKAMAELKLKIDTKNLMSANSITDEEIDVIREKCEKLAGQLEMAQKDSLANYVIYRKGIIELLDKKLKLKDDEKFNNEAVIHDIIFPRFKNSDEIPYESHNLWLIDERLTFHSFAASEPILESNERPDILIYSEYDAPLKIARDVSIIELKRPGLLDAMGNPIGQLNKYQKAILHGKFILPDGRMLKIHDSTHFFLYLICDINEKIQDFIQDDGYFVRLKNDFGYYKFNPGTRAHIEIIAYDKLIVDALQRHRIFFNKLGLPENF